MNSFILINDVPYATDTDSEIELAQKAMREEGITQAEIYVGDADCPDSYKGTDSLFVTNGDDDDKITLGIVDGKDWGCEYTQDEFDAFWRIVETKVEESYPQYRVEIDITDSCGDRRVSLFPGDSTSESQINECFHNEDDVRAVVRAIFDRVWDDGEFWSVAS